MLLIFCYPMRDVLFSSNHELHVNYYSVEHKQMISTNRNLFVKHYCMLSAGEILWNDNSVNCLNKFLWRLCPSNVVHSPSYCLCQAFCLLSTRTINKCTPSLKVKHPKKFKKKIAEQMHALKMKIENCFFKIRCGQSIKY